MEGGGLSGRVRGVSSAVIGYELLAKVCFSVSGPVFDLIFVSLCAKEEGAGIRDSGGWGRSEGVREVVMVAALSPGSPPNPLLLVLPAQNICRHFPSLEASHHFPVLVS